MHQPRDAILDAADTRFADYGYAKTTMAEIAADCGMSVGNLYRHFRNKEAIALAAMQRLLEAKLAAGQQAAASETNALAAIEAFLVTRLRIAHAHYARTRHLFDVMRLVNERHRDLLLDYEQRVIATLADILQRGETQGLFALDDPMQTAHDIHQATLRYNHPICLKNNPLDALETDLRRLIALLHRGLAPRQTTKEGTA